MSIETNHSTDTLTPSGTTLTLNGVSIREPTGADPVIITSNAGTVTNNSVAIALATCAVTL